MSVVAITGPYCAGKSTLMRERAEQLRAAGIEPICIDYDQIAVAFGSTVQHGHAEQFTALTQRVRGLAIKLALEASRDQGATVLIVDASPTEARWQQYRDAGAEIVELRVDPAVLHARADAERPTEWHRYIDEWTPTAPPWQQRERKAWPKRPDYRKATASRAYHVKRKAFLADKTNCENCGKVFVTDAPCSHPSCRRRGGGCVFFHAYPTVQHTVHLAGPDSPPSLDTDTWAAWCAQCNASDGGRHSGMRRRGPNGPRHSGATETTSLDW